MSIQLSVVSLLIIVCAHARVQQQQQQQQHQSFHPGDDHDDPGSKLNPLHRRAVSQRRDGQDSYQNLRDGGHSGLLSPRGALDILPSEVKADVLPFSSSRSGQAMGQLSSRESRLERLMFLQSSVRHALDSASLEASRKQDIAGASSPRFGQEDAPLNSSALPSMLLSSLSKETSEAENEGQTAENGGAAHEADQLLSGEELLAVPVASSHISNSNISGHHHRHQQPPVTLSSLLQDAFVERNPTTPPSSFMGAAAESQHYHQHQHDHQQQQADPADSLQESDSSSSLSSSSSSPSSFKLSAARQNPLTKRDPEVAPKEDTAQQGHYHNNSRLSVQERSSRCSIADELVGDGDLPWTCQQRWAWRFLGEHVYPSRVYEAVCEGRTCWYGHFNCTPITYTLHVLELCMHGCHDQRVPYPLRSFWQWTDLNVTVGCQCVR